MAESKANNIEQIRELIFGSQIKAFEEKFQQLEAALKEIETKMTKSIEGSLDTLKKEIKRALDLLEQKVENINQAGQKERNAIKELIRNSEETLQTQVDHQKKELESKLQALQAQMDDDTKKMNETLQALKSELEEKMYFELQKLGQNKLSRDAMATMLMDVAIKIQGSDIQALMEEEIQSEAK